MSLSLVYVQSVFRGECSLTNGALVLVSRDNISFSLLYRRLFRWFYGWVGAVWLLLQEVFLSFQVPPQLRWAQPLPVHHLGGAFPGVQGEGVDANGERKVEGLSFAHKCLANLQALGIHVSFKLVHLHGQEWYLSSHRSGLMFWWSPSIFIWSGKMGLSSFQACLSSSTVAVAVNYSVV